MSAAMSRDSRTISTAGKFECLISPRAAAVAYMPPEPMPIFQAQPGVGMYPNPQYQQPPLPPYAWPTYAPYNNYSRVAYPTLYPYEAWPFIGPFYPFPRVPLGWRSVPLIAVAREPRMTAQGDSQ